MNILILDLKKKEEKQMMLYHIICLN